MGKNQLTELWEVVFILSISKGTAGNYFIIYTNKVYFDS